MFITKTQATHYFVVVVILGWDAQRKCFVSGTDPQCFTLPVKQSTNDLKNCFCTLI